MEKIIVGDEYNLEKCIGKGTYGNVYYTTKKGSNIPYATKRMKRETVEEPSYVFPFTDKAYGFGRTVYFVSSELIIIFPEESVATVAAPVPYILWLAVTEPFST